MSDGGWMPQMRSEQVVRLRRPRLWAQPKHSPEMELVLALVAALQERSGTKTIGTTVLNKLGDALHQRTDTPDAPAVHWRTDPSIYAAVNALCGGF